MSGSSNSTPAEAVTTGATWLDHDSPPVVIQPPRAKDVQDPAGFNPCTGEQSRKPDAPNGHLQSDEGQDPAAHRSAAPEWLLRHQYPAI